MDNTSTARIGDESMFVSAIHDYCDRWCERCRLSSRCLVFARQQARGDPANDEDLLRQVTADLAEAATLLQDEANRQGIVLPEPDPASVACEKATDDVVDNHPLIAAARLYENEARGWLDANRQIHTGAAAGPATSGPQPVGAATARPTVARGANRRKAPEADLSREDAIEIIERYHYFIGIKLRRAVRSHLLEQETASRDDHARSDADGSAKVALLTLELALDAWFEIMFYVEDVSSVMQPLLALSNVRDGTHYYFPMAHAFVRPGFDTGDEPWPAGAGDIGPQRH
jgi:hypothetical protein